MSTARYALAGWIAGFIAGGTVGALEGIWVFARGPQFGASAPLYGVLFYGFLLAIVALPSSVGLSYFPRKNTPTPQHIGLVLALVLGVPTALVVLRFRLLRDLFHERLPLMTPSGAALHLALLCATLATVWCAWRIFNSTTERTLPGPRFAAIACTLLVLGSLTFLAFSPHTSIHTTTATTAAHPTFLMMVDTLRADRLTTDGYAPSAGPPTTPHLAEFAKDAVQFDNAFAQSSWTRPSVASLLTSLPPSDHKTQHKDDQLPERVTTIAETFQAANQPTLGLVTNYNLAPYFNYQQGFDSYRYLEPKRFLWGTDGADRLSLYRLARAIHKRLIPAQEHPSVHYWNAQRATDALIASTNTQPSFVFMTYMDPHDPYFARDHTGKLTGKSFARVHNTNPAPKMAAQMSAAYDQEIRYWDSHFGRWLAHLKKTGIYDTSIIIITSDHGEEFQDHGGWWHGTTLYEEQIRVPLFIKLPNNRNAATRRSDLARLIDVPPTIAALAGLKPDPSWKGRDLFSTTAPPDTVFAEVDHQGNALRAARSSTWKLIEANPDNPRGLKPRELYRIANDPHERRNLATDHPTRVKALQKTLR